MSAYGAGPGRGHEIFAWLLVLMMAILLAILTIRPASSETPREQQRRFQREFNTSLLHTGPHDYRARDSFVAAQIADVALTAYIIESDCGVEANPLVSWVGKDSGAKVGLAAAALGYAQYKFIRSIASAARSGKQRRTIWRVSNVRWLPVLWNARVLKECGR